MKVLTLNRNKVKLYTITDVARALGACYGVLWQQIYIRAREPFEAPAFQFGRRSYYTQEQYERLTAPKGTEEKIG